MDGYQIKHFDIHSWEVVCIEEEYYRLLRCAGHKVTDAMLTDEDRDMLLDVYHYWKILYEHRFPTLEDMDLILHMLHFDVILELYCYHKIGRAYHGLRYIFD